MSNEYTDDLDSLYSDLVELEFVGVSKYTKGWLDDYNILDIDLDTEVYPKVFLNGAGPVTLDTPEKVIGCFGRGKDIAFYPDLKNIDLTQKSIDIQFGLFRSFPELFIQDFINLGTADYGNYRFFRYPEVICMQNLHGVGKPKYWLTNTYSIANSRETIREDIKSFKSELSILFKLAGIDNVPRYVSKGSMARKLYLSLCPDFQYNEKVLFPPDFYKPFMSLKGQRFTTLGVGPTGNKITTDFSRFYKNIASELSPTLLGENCFTAETPTYQPDATDGTIFVTGVLPEINGMGVIPVREKRGSTMSKDMIGRDIKTGISYPIGPIDTPVQIDLSEYRKYKIELGANLKIEKGFWVIPKGNSRRDYTTKWSTEVGKLVDRDERFKFLYQFANTGGTYDRMIKVTENPDGTLFTVPQYYFKDTAVVAGNKFIQLSKIFGISRVSMFMLAQSTGSKSLIADGGDANVLGTPEINGLPVKYEVLSKDIFIYNITRRDKEGSEWRDLTHKFRDRSFIPTVVRSRVGLNEAKSPTQICVRITRKRQELPGTNDFIMPPIKRLGEIENEFKKGKPKKTKEMGF